MDNVRPLHPAPDEGSPETSPEEMGRTTVLVLSRDSALIETAKRAAGAGTQVVSIAEADKVAAKISVLKPGILLVDTATVGDFSSMLSQFKQHFPELVLIVAGKREEGAELMRLTASGGVFRFLLTPLSQGQTQLALEAANTHHYELIYANQRLPNRHAPAAGGKSSRTTYIALAVGAVVAIVGVWFAMRMFSAPPKSAPVAPAPVASSLPEKPDPVQAEIALAKEAFDKGSYLEPHGESALDLYRGALALDANSAAAQAGIRSVADKVLDNAERELTSEHLEDAIRDLETARDIDPKHPRLAFLDVQVARERERLKLSQTRETATRMRTLLAQSKDRIQNNQLIAPTGSSARDALVEARRIDPTDPAVAQGFRDLSARLVEEAQAALKAGKPRDAQTYVESARQLGSAGTALASVDRAIAEALNPPAPQAPAPRPAAAENSPALAARTQPAPATAEPKPAGAPGSNAPENTAGDAIVQAIQLPRRKEVQPKYPREALLDRQEGWVVVDFTISPDGVPQELKVRESQPRRIFDRAALDCVQQWRFEPVTHGGQAVAQRATLKIQFKL
jgi:protein TonB